MFAGSLLRLCTVLAEAFAQKWSWKRQYKKISQSFQKNNHSGVLFLKKIATFNFSKNVVIGSEQLFRRAHLDGFFCNGML